MKVFIVIAAYNEEKHILDVVKEVKKYCKNIIVVDDGSKDKTKLLAQELGVIVLSHIINLGKGAAIKTGCDYAIKKNAEAIVLIDGDGQHDPELIPVFLEKLKRKDIIFGYRKFSKEMPFVFRFGNYFINKVSEILFKIKIRDTQCGYRAFTDYAYRKIRWNATDYSMESEMIANAGMHKLKYSQIPIKTKYNDKYKGTTVIDGVVIVLNMLRKKIGV